MKVFAEKRKELSQTIVSLIDSLRKEAGCRRCDFCQSMENRPRYGGGPGYSGPEADVRI